MILFKKFFIPHILNQIQPQKVVTRRTGKLRWNINSIHNFQTNYNPNSAFARGKIISVTRGKLFDMTEKDAHQEGCNSLVDFKEVWTNINGEWKNTDVWIVQFIIVENLLTHKNEPALHYFR